MEIAKGYCRLKLNSGLIAFGEILEIKESHVLFQGFSPAAIGRRIPIENITEFQKYKEDDVPPYE